MTQIFFRSPNLSWAEAARNRDDFIRKQLLTLLKVELFRDTGSITGQGTKIPHAVWHGQKKTEKKKF